MERCLSLEMVIGGITAFQSVFGTFLGNQCGSELLGKISWPRGQLSCVLGLCVIPSFFVVYGWGRCVPLEIYLHICVLGLCMFCTCSHLYLCLEWVCLGPRAVCVSCLRNVSSLSVHVCLFTCAILTEYISGCGHGCALCFLPVHPFCWVPTVGTCCASVYIPCVGSALPNMHYLGDPSHRFLLLPFAK